ncbi:TorF family putative porin [Sphingomonas sp. HF-S4]|uniref:TorF family putative porin n=1 Tax=Sphingomonas agrestis TaxID=3080540 RepID=A0ABU3YAF2_9SPHN|nr:TorF family putative porin [Sphingomonas sp. HF-S4]MDV3458107.1 TorF family putative porin [Sphingomonas sp. HF-S4]
MRYLTITLAGLMLAAATPALAQDEAEPAKPVTVTGGVTVTSDYRFRGLTQTDKKVALQGTVNVNHESGLYVGTWASTLDDEVSLPGYGDAEIDLYAGYTKTLDSGVGFDVGMLYYYYPGGADGLDTDFFEPYASVMYTVGPVTAKVGANYAWSGQSGLADQDSLYLRGDLTVGIPNTPVSLLGHIGHTDGQLGILAPDAKYTDWSLGAEIVHKFVKLGVQYVDTDITNDADYADAIGADPKVLFYATLSF